MSGQRTVDAVLNCTKLISARKYFVRNSHNKFH